MTVDELVRSLGLLPHPEGGYYRETFRSAGSYEVDGGARRWMTSIEYLLPAGGVSRLHRLKSDEVWYFHEGGPLAVVELRPDGELAHTVLGPGRAYQRAVGAGTWFGAYALPGTAYALVGCAVAPGFDFADFELGERAALTEAFPAHAELIARLTAA